jgi:hypothetical protein
MQLSVYAQPHLLARLQAALRQWTAALVGPPKIAGDAIFLRGSSVGVV